MKNYQNLIKRFFILAIILFNNVVFAQTNGFLYFPAVWEVTGNTPLDVSKFNPVQVEFVQKGMIAPWIRNGMTKSLFQIHAQNVDYNHTVVFFNKKFVELPPGEYTSITFSTTDQNANAITYKYEINFNIVANQ